MDLEKEFGIWIEPSDQVVRLLKLRDGKIPDMFPDEDVISEVVPSENVVTQVLRLTDNRSVLIQIGNRNVGVVSADNGSDRRHSLRMLDENFIAQQDETRHKDQDLIRISEQNGAVALQLFAHFFETS